MEELARRHGDDALGGDWRTDGAKVLRRALTTAPKVTSFRTPNIPLHFDIYAPVSIYSLRSKLIHTVDPHRQGFHSHRDSLDLLWLNFATLDDRLQPCDHLRVDRRRVELVEFCLEILLRIYI